LEGTAISAIEAVKTSRRTVPSGAKNERGKPRRDTEGGSQKGRNFIRQESTFVHHELAPEKGGPLKRGTPAERKKERRPEKARLQEVQRDKRYCQAPRRAIDERSGNYLRPKLRLALGDAGILKKKGLPGEGREGGT